MQPAPHQRAVDFHLVDVGQTGRAVRHVRLRIAHKERVARDDQRVLHLVVTHQVGQGHAVITGDFRQRVKLLYLINEEAVARYFFSRLDFALRVRLGSPRLDGVELVLLQTGAERPLPVAVLPVIFVRLRENEVVGGAVRVCV